MTELSLETILLLVILFMVMNKTVETFGHCPSHNKSQTSTHKLNKIIDLSTFNPPTNVNYVNTLNGYNECNLTKVNNLDVNTYNDAESIPSDSEHCAMYCAHSGCNSAMNFYNKKENKKIIHDKCSNVHYIKGGAKDMLKDERKRFQMVDASKCSEKLGL